LLFVLVFRIGVNEVLTDVEVGAIATILGFIAADFCRGEVVAIFGSSLGLHPEHGEDIALAFDVLGGDLEAVEDESRATRVEFTGGHAVEHISKGNLDGASVFEDGEVKRLIGDFGVVSSTIVHTRVEVAKLLAAQGRRVTNPAVGHDVTTDEMHETPPPPPYVQVNSLF
jgi:hypothetical protein